MFSTVISAVVLLLTATDVLAAPQATGTLLPLPTICTVPDYQAFKLFARRTSTGVDYPIRLLADEVTAKNVTSHMIVDTNSTCVNCGVVPSYWVLKNMKLRAADTTVSGVAVTTLNQQADQGSELHFLTSATVKPEYPIYCAETTGAATPPVLAVHGSSKLFTMCAFTSVSPPATIFSIIYDKFSIQPVGESCYPVTLIMQAIGIVPP